jgi:hypothetical protein
MVFAFWRSSFNSKFPGDMSADEAASNSVAFPDLYAAGIAELQQALDKGQFASVVLVEVGPVSACLRFPGDISVL